MTRPPSWLTVFRGHEPLVLSIPHSGLEIPDEFHQHLDHKWRAHIDADFWVDDLYNFADDLGATLVITSISRTVIDVNRDPSGKSLYPGQATTELCPTTTFDGEPLYENGFLPDADEITRRRKGYYQPYHDALATELVRLGRDHDAVVLFDAHSIRSQVPRLFEGELPHLNLGTNDGASSSPLLTRRLESICDETVYTRVTNGRFKGGYITRHYGSPDDGVHAVQLELAMRTYMTEPKTLSPDNWPAPYDARITYVRSFLSRLLQACIDFAHRESP